MSDVTSTEWQWASLRDAQFAAEAIRQAAEMVRDEYRPLLDLILRDMPAATNRDLACDGPVGNEEGEVWKRIEKTARELADA